MCSLRWAADNFMYCESISLLMGILDGKPPVS